MYDASDIARVRELLAEGWSKAAIAKQLRISRRVIYNWAAAGYLVSEPREPRTPLERRVRAGGRSKLDAYAEEIDRQLAANPAVSTRVVLRALRSIGYDGELTQLRAHLATRRRAFVGEGEVGSAGGGRSEPEQVERAG